MFIVDFDDTLFDTQAFKEARCRALKECGVSEELFWETYRQARHSPDGLSTYSNNRHAEILVERGFEKACVLDAFDRVTKARIIAYKNMPLGIAPSPWGQITGKIDTKEKFEANRMAMAEREWERMKARDSIECRNCHSFDAMSPDIQKKTPYKKHMDAKAEGKSCIDCHQGIAHKLPKGFKKPGTDDEEE